MTSIVIQGLYYLMQRMLNSVLLHPLYDRRVPAEEANNNELMWSGFEGEKKTGQRSFERGDKCYCTFWFGLLRIQPECWVKLFFFFFFPWLSISDRIEGWPVGRYSMAIISVKSNKNQACKGNKLIFLHLCIVLQIYSVFTSYYLAVFAKKNCDLCVQPLPSFQPR